MEAINQIIKVFQGFDVHPMPLLFAIINFSVVLVVLKIFAVKPFQDMLEKRRQMISDAVKKAEEVERQLKDANEEKARIINEANKSAAAIMDSAKANAITVKDRIISEANNEATNIKTKAVETSVLERDKLMKTAKEQIATLVMGVTENVIGRTLTTDDQNRISKEASLKIAG
jgi:F-type H+-transporting ATPase subunit b